MWDATVSILGEIPRSGYVLKAALPVSSESDLLGIALPDNDGRSFVVTQQIAINAVAILPSKDDRLGLGEIFRHSKWHLYLSDCLNDARNLLNKNHIGVVLTDCRLPDGGWKDVLHETRLRDLAAPPVIVVSRLADERLWAEVLNLRGYDVLATPFHADEVLWSISSAWRHWRDNCALSATGTRTHPTQPRSAEASEESESGTHTAPTVEVSVENRGRAPDSRGRSGVSKCVRFGGIVPERTFPPTPCEPGL